MKKISLFAIASSAALMTACTDYVSKIEDLEKETPALNPSNSTETISGCQCSIVPTNLDFNGIYYYYDYSLRGDGDIYWKVDGCNAEYFFLATMAETGGGSFVYQDKGYGTSAEFPARVTTGEGGNASIKVDVKKDESTIETLLCPAVEVRGVNYGSSSGSTDDVLSTSSYSFYPTTACGDLWCGLTDTKGKVETGLEVDGNAGYWYSYGDGYSNFTYPAPGVIDNKFGPLVSTHKAIYAKIALENGADYPFAAFAFNLVSGLEDGADISDWDGICLVYGATYGFELELGVENEAVLTEYNNYKAAVPSFIVTHTIDIPWSSFKQESGWGEKLDRTEALKRVSVIRLKYSGNPGSSTTVFIQSIGRYGTCQ